MARTPLEIQFRELESQAAQCSDDKQRRPLLKQIKATGLWRSAYETWTEYLEKRWDIYDR